jgi:hypothetical protein
MAGTRTDFQYPIRAETRHYTPTLHSTIYTYACNGCGKECRGYAQKRVKGHIWCNECNKKRQRKYVANSKKKSVLAEIKDNLDIHEIDGIFYYKVEDLLELFKQEN